MSSLTNFGEALCLTFGVGYGNSANVFGTQNFYIGGTAGVQVALANADPSFSPESGSFILPFSSQSNLGYAQQIGLFAQPTYPTGSNECFATNTNAITFGPAQSDWGTFNYIIFRTSTGTTVTATTAGVGTATVYYQLPSPVTITNGESYIIPAGALRLTFEPNTPANSTTFTALAKRSILDTLLGIQDADSAARDAFYNKEYSATTLITPVTSSQVGSTALVSDDVQLAAAQPFTPNYNSFDADAERQSYTGETRVSNLNAITFTFPPDQVDSAPRTITHLMIFSSALVPIAYVPLATPVTFSPANNLIAPAGTISLAFN